MKGTNHFSLLDHAMSKDYELNKIIIEFIENQQKLKWHKLKLKKYESAVNMKNQAIVVRKYGGPSVLKLENTEIDEPRRNEILLRQTGIGVNYHDIYDRSELYKTLDIPGIPGCEGVGIIKKKVLR